MISAAKFVVFVAALSRFANGEAATELREAAAEGAPALQVDDVAGLKVGDTIEIDDGKHVQRAVIKALKAGENPQIELEDALEFAVENLADVRLAAQGAQEPAAGQGAQEPAAGQGAQEPREPAAGQGAQEPAAGAAQELAGAAQDAAAHAAAAAAGAAAAAAAVPEPSCKRRGVCEVKCAAAGLAACGKTCCELHEEALEELHQGDSGDPDAEVKCDKVHRIVQRRCQFCALCHVKDANRLLTDKKWLLTDGLPRAGQWSLPGAATAALAALGAAAVAFGRWRAAQAPAGARLLEAGEEQPGEEQSDAPINSAEC